jgi:hypothetical protein
MGAKYFSALFQQAIITGFFVLLTLLLITGIISILLLAILKFVRLSR